MVSIPDSANIIYFLIIPTSGSVYGLWWRIVYTLIIILTTQVNELVGENEAA